MCMEDVLLGHQMRSNQVAHTAGVTASLALDSDKNRTVIIFNPPITGQITYALKQSPALGEGINLAAGCDPLVLDIKTHGDLVTKKWYSIADLAGRKADILVACLYE